MILTYKTLSALCAKMYHPMPRHRKEVTFDPHCLDDISNPNTEAQAFGNDTLIILGFSALTYVLVAAINAVFI